MSKSPQTDADKAERSRLDMRILPEDLKSQSHRDTVQQEPQTRIVHNVCIRVRLYDLFLIPLSLCPDEKPRNIGQTVHSERFPIAP